MKRVHFKYWLRKERLIEHFYVCTQDGVGLCWLLSLDRAEKARELFQFGYSDKRSFKPIYGPTLQAVVYCDPEGLCSCRSAKLCSCNVLFIEKSMNQPSFSLKQTTPEFQLRLAKTNMRSRMCHYKFLSCECSVTVYLYLKCPLKTQLQKVLAHLKKKGLIETCSKRSDGHYIKLSIKANRSTEYFASKIRTNLNLDNNIGTISQKRRFVLWYLLRNSWLFYGICKNLKWLLITPARSLKHKWNGQPHSWQEHASFEDARVWGVHSTCVIPQNLVVTMRWSLQSDNQSNLHFSLFSDCFINNCVFFSKGINLSTTGRNNGLII